MKAAISSFECIAYEVCKGNFKETKFLLRAGTPTVTPYDAHLPHGWRQEVTVDLKHIDKTSK